MEHWEFLIQKEGDQAWLPLESHQVEILAGRYQVVAHTSHIDTAVEVRVSQMILDEMPPRRRVRKRLGQTDADGLIRVIPFMWLQQGRWELSCSSTSIADELLGQGWQHSIQLQVLPLTEADQDWPLEGIGVDEESAAAIRLVPGSEPNINLPTHPEDDIAPVAYPAAEALTEQIVHSLYELSEPILGADASPLVQAQARLQPTEVALDSGYRVSLRQQAYIAQRQKPLVIVGQIQLDAHAQAPTLLDGQLWIRLRHPHGQPISETRRRLQAAPLPVDFKVQVQLPVSPETRVILGEVWLRSEAAETVQRPPVLAATFTITAGLDDLLEALASPAELSFDEEISVFPGTTVPFGQPRSSPTTLISPELPLWPLPPQRLVPAVGQVLPPRLDYCTPGSKSAANSVRVPQLPVFAPAASALSQSDRSAVRLKNSQPQGENSSASKLSLEANDLEADVWSDPIAEPAVEPEAGHFEKPAPRPTAATEPQLPQKLQKPQIHLPKFPTAARRQPAIFDSDSIEDSDLDADWVASTLAELDSLGQRPVQLSPAAPLSEPDAHSFHAEPPQPQTGLSNRFMSRLSDLTHASRQATTELRKLMQAAGVQSSELVDSESPPPPSEPVPALPSGVVIDDEPPLAVPVEPSAEGTAAEIISPVIAIPNRELTAGETIVLTVRLRPQQFQLYIKLWASDRQTRTLIGEPYLLMDLAPNPLGELEAELPMPIPPNCLEIQFAAIAIDPETRQESDKAVVNRHIVPPGLPTQSLDDRG